MGAITKSEMREKTKTKALRVYNEELDCFEWRKEEISKFVFDEEDKIAMAREYVERGCPASEIVSKYHISRVGYQLSFQHVIDSLLTGYQHPFNNFSSFFGKYPFFSINGNG